MAKVKNDYFLMLKDQIGYSVSAADLLCELLSDFTEQNVELYKGRIHEIEHSGDTAKADILSKLYAEFITPIDQEDILHLSQIIDDVTDAIDETVLDIYMYHVASLPPHAKRLGEAVRLSVKAFADAVSELKNFKKPEALNEILDRINKLETEADDIFGEAIYELFSNEYDCKALISCKAIYESLENCCDLCEHATDIISQIIIKNT